MDRARPVERWPINHPRRAHRNATRRGPGWLCVLVVILAAASARPQRAAAYDPPPPATYTDPDYDAVARRTDAGGTAPYDANPRHLVDFHSLTLGRWRPENPQVDRFVGDYFPSGRYACVEIVLGGLHNPPGDTDPGHFMPLAYGDNPVYGFVELDVDNDNDTGGEVDAPQYRYPANIARFGGLPEGDAFEHRIAKSADAFDGDFQTMPYVERQGEEFHLALLGGQFDASGVDVVAGDADLKFEAGEIWNITGTWFHRAHGFFQPTLKRIHQAVNRLLGHVVPVFRLLGFIR